MKRSTILHDGGLQTCVRTQRGRYNTYSTFRTLLIAFVPRLNARDILTTHRLMKWTTRKKRCQTPQRRASLRECESELSSLFSLS